VSRRTPWARRDDERDDWRRHRPASAWPTTALWRWRYEVLVTSGLSGGVVGLSQVAGGAHQAVAIVVATGVTAASVPMVRRGSVLLWWHVATPHLFRRCCADLGFVDHNGRLPAVLRTRTTRRGQHLTVWASAGVSLKDFRKARDELATGLWAQDVLVGRHRRFGQLVVVTVVREDLTSRRATSARSWPSPEEWGWVPGVVEVEEDRDDDEPLGSDGDEAAFVELPKQRELRELGVEGGTS
jgi:hypothetical protein